MVLSEIKFIGEKIGNTILYNVTYYTLPEVFKTIFLDNLLLTWHLLNSIAKLILIKSDSKLMLKLGTFP